MRYSCNLPGQLLLVFLKIVEERILSFDNSTSHIYETEIGYDASIYEFSPFPILRVNREGEFIKGSVSLEGLFACSFDKMKKKGTELFAEYFKSESEHLKRIVESIFDGDVSFKRIGEVKVTTSEKHDKWVNMGVLC